MNVILVDDEPQIQKWVQLMLEKSRYPLLLKGVFSNGKEAFEYCAAQPVDLVITDIRMPIMDGLALIQQLKSYKPHIRFLILSAYDEFQYASEGMRLGASDYLLKAEITTQELWETLQRIENDIRQDERIDRELTDMRKTINGNLAAFRRLYLKELIRDEETAIQSFAKKKEALDLKIDSRHLMLMAIGFDEAAFRESKQRFRSRELLELAVANVVEETLASELGSGHAFSIENTLFAAMFNLPNIGSRSIRERSLHLASQISAHLWQYLNIKATIGISEWYGELRHVGQQWKEAETALRHLLFYGRQTVIGYKDLEIGKQWAAAHDESFRRVNETLEFDDYMRFQQEVHQYIREIGNRRELSEAEVKLKFTEIVHCLRRKVPNFVKSEEEDHSLPDIHDKTTYAACSAWLLQHVETFLHNLYSMNRSPAIVQLCQYLEHHYMRDISLQNAADIVHLNKTYLSGLFKKEMGINFYDYFTHLRITKAKDLIRSNACTIGELAETVGYKNQSHFTKVFKKITGMSPMEYKHRVAKRPEDDGAWNRTSE